MKKIFIKLLFFISLVVVTSCNTGLESPISKITIGSTQIMIDFGDPIDPRTVTEETLFMPEGVNSGFCILENAVDATVDVPNSKHARLVPAAFKSNTEYSVCVTSGIKYSDGTDFEGMTSTFVSADTEGPRVENQFPLNLATDVPLNIEVQVVFNEAIDSSTINENTFTLSGTLPVAGSVSYDPSTMRAVFTPSANLDSFVTYTVTLSGSIMDVAGNELGSDYSWTFTTSDVIAPTVAIVLPTNNDVDVPIDTDITVIFSEFMDQTTINAASFTLEKTAGGSVSCTIGGADDTATSTPDSSLDVFTNYKATITSDITDLSGNPLATNYIWNFTTESAYWIKSSVETRNVMQITDGNFILGGTYGNRFWIAKQDFEGNIAWQRRVGSATRTQTLMSLQPTSDGGFISAGETYSGTGFRFDWWIVKFDSNGIYEWQTILDANAGIDDRDRAWIARETTDGGYIAAGRLDTDGGLGDVWYGHIVKLDSLGNISWQRSVGLGITTDSEIRDIQQTSDGGYIAGGWYSTTGPTNYRAWVLKLNSAGVVQWQKEYDDPAGAQTIQAIREDSDGNFVFVGYTTSQALGVEDVWVVKLDSLGTVMWQYGYGMSAGDYGQGLYVNSSGNYVVLGRSNGFDIGVVGTHPWALEINSTNGDIIWERLYDAGAPEIFYSASEVTDGGYIMSCSGCVVKANSTGDIPGCANVYETTATKSLTTMTTAGTAAVAGGTIVGGSTAYASEDTGLVPSTTCSSP